MQIEIDDLSQAFQLTARLKAKGVPVSFKAHQTDRGRKSAFHAVVFPDDFDKVVHEEMQVLGMYIGDEDIRPSRTDDTYKYYR